MPIVKPLLFLFVSGILLVFMGCNDYVTVEYIVKNKTKKTVKLKITNYHPDEYHPYGSKPIDTVIELKANETVNVDYVRAQHSVIGSTKALYRKQPGVANFNVIQNDTLLKIDKTPKHWKYSHGNSVFKIKKYMLQK